MSTDRGRTAAPSSPSVVLVCGPAGAGKSTHARRLADDGYAVLSFDAEAWRRGLRDHPVDAEDAAAVHAHLQRELLRHVAAGDRVVVDTSFWSRSSRDAYRDLLRPHGVEPVVHLLDTPRDVVLERLAARRHRGPDDVAVPRARAEAYLDGFQVPTPDEGPLVVLDGRDRGGVVE
ncbi:ATP-binding protein [Isoptericola sp. b408]|uniref:AAA family ATPase n=1 Tax=Isoptericola sp. b408 TaxID=3064653 RepID=UPI00271384B2|nr:ATP-binding protein [Isoptericola sp. b408]MDO8150558.1 ATP-binding protein [Isoptericola sp. b408]